MDEAFSASLSFSGESAQFQETELGGRGHSSRGCYKLRRPAEDNEMSLAQDTFVRCAEADETECSLGAKTISKSGPTPLDPIAQLTFEAKPYDLSALPNDEEAAENAVLELTVFRLAAGLMRHDHKELELLARQETPALLRLLELIGSQITLKKHDVSTLECVRTRLIIVLSRLADSLEADAAPLKALSALDPASPSRR
jgi:hypothetical protein